MGAASPRRKSARLRASAGSPEPKDGKHTETEHDTNPAVSSDLSATVKFERPEWLGLRRGSPQKGCAVVDRPRNSRLWIAGL